MAEKSLKDLYCKHVKTRACLGKGSGEQINVPHDLKLVFKYRSYGLEKSGQTDACTNTEVTTFCSLRAGLTKT